MTIQWILAVLLLAAAVSGFKIEKKSLDSSYEQLDSALIQNNIHGDSEQGIFKLKKLYQKIAQADEVVNEGEMHQLLSILKKDLVDQSTFSNINEVHT